MARHVLRGRLRAPEAAPARGETVERLFEGRGVLVEQILSGALEAPADFREDRDEWVALLAGRARLEVAGEELELAAGDWLLLPAGLEHRLLETEPGSSWLAVHLPAATGAPPPAA